MSKSGIKWQLENPEKKKAADARYRANHPDRVKKSRKIFNEKYPEKVAESQTKWKAENPDGTKNIKRKHLYGLTKEEYKALQTKQQGQCAICFQEKPLQIDHCHETGKVRGLLCGPCNRGIGLFEENISSLRNAIEYLQ